MVRVAFIAPSGADGGGVSAMASEILEALGGDGSGLSDMTSSAAVGGGSSKGGAQQAGWGGGQVVGLNCITKPPMTILLK